MRGLSVTEGGSRRWLLALALALATAVMLSLGAASTHEAWAQSGDGQQPSDDQYEDGEDENGEDTAETSDEYTSDEYGPCAGAAEQLQAERPNVPDGVIERYLNYLPDVDGCVSFEGTTFIDGLSVPVFEPDTGEELGILKDLDPDLTSGDFSLTYEEFCEGFIPQILTAQDYFDQQANAQEQAILDPDGDGLACASDTDDGSGGGGTDEPEEPAGGDDPCAGLEDILGLFDLLSYPDAGGCIFLTGQLIELTLDQLHAPVYEPGTGEELGILKDLDPDLTSGDFSVSYEEFCGAFPTTEAEGFSYAGLTAQEYFDQEANDQEQAILDPDGDGTACTPEDEEFLAGSGDSEPELEFEQTWVGQITQSGEDGEVTGEYGVEANIIPISDMTGDLIGEVVGEVRYDDLNCSGVWVLEEVNEDSVLIEEEIKEGFFSCVSDTPITLTPQDDGSLEYYFESRVSDQTGRGILTLQGDAPENGEDTGGDWRPDDDQRPDDGGQRSGGGQQSGGGLWPSGGQWTPPRSYEEPPSIINSPNGFTTYIVNNPRDFVWYCGGVMSETYRGLPQGRLPETGGGWTVLLLSGAALIGGGWSLVRLARRFSR